MTDEENIKFKEMSTLIGFSLGLLMKISMQRCLDQDTQRIIDRAIQKIDDRVNKLFYT